MNFTSWDYDKNITTEWLRMGECNHCGECCQVIIDVMTKGTYHSPRDGAETTDDVGLWCEWEAYGRRRFWKIEIKLDESCECYEDLGKDCYDGAPGKGIICTAWPLHPDHVACFDNCSYSFVKIKEWPIEEKKEQK